MTNVCASPTITVYTILCKYFFAEIEDDMEDDIETYSASRHTFHIPLD